MSNRYYYIFTFTLCLLLLVCLFKLWTKEDEDSWDGYENLNPSFPGSNYKIPTFQEFINKYNKTYADIKERRLAHIHFTEATSKIHIHNNVERSSYRMAINFFSDWNETVSSGKYDENTRKLRLNDILTLVGASDFYSNESEIASLVDSWPINSLDNEPPDQVDWSLRPDVVGDVKFQGSCGSCWAFGVTGLLEGQQHKYLNISNVEPNNYYNVSQKVIALSEQQLIDCDKHNYGCRGGSAGVAAAYLNSIGGQLQTATQYPNKPYNESSNYQVCQWNKTISNPDKELAFLKPQVGDIKLLMKVVAYYGPVYVSLIVDENFQYYADGIYESDKSANYKHAGVLVGYGQSPGGKDYWIVKNSYGSDWGIDGYCLIARNELDMTKVASGPSIYIERKKSIK